MLKNELIVGYAIKCARRRGLFNDCLDIGQEVWMECNAVFALFVSCGDDVLFEILRRMTNRVVQRYYRERFRRAQVFKQLRYDVEPAPIGDEVSEEEQAAIVEAVGKAFYQLSDDEFRLVVERVCACRTLGAIGKDRGWDRQKTERKLKNILKKIKAMTPSHVRKQAEKLTSYS